MADPDDNQPPQSADPGPHDTWMQGLGVTLDSLAQAVGFDRSGTKYDSNDPLHLNSGPIYPPAPIGPPKPPSVPNWVWDTLPPKQDTPEWKKWYDAVDKWCKDNHVDLGPIMDMAKDKINSAQPNRNAQPDGTLKSLQDSDPRKSAQGISPKGSDGNTTNSADVTPGDDDSSTTSGPTKTIKKPAPDPGIPVPPPAPPPQPDDGIVPNGDTAVA